MAACATSPLKSSEPLLWNVNSLDAINGEITQAQGNPVVVDSRLGKVVRFDGEGDRLLVDANW